MDSYICDGGSCPREEPQPAPSGEALEALDRLAQPAKLFAHDPDSADGGAWVRDLEADLALVRRALSGLPQPTPTGEADRP